MIPEGGTVLRKLHDPVILDIATSVKIDKLQSGAPPDQLVEGLVTNVDTALHTSSDMETLERMCDHLGYESVEQRTSLGQGRHPRSCHHLAPGEVNTHKLRTASTQRTEAVVCHVVTRGDVHPYREFHGK